MKRPEKGCGRDGAAGLPCPCQRISSTSPARRNPGKGWFGTRGGAFLRGTVIGHGVVPVEACLRILKMRATMEPSP